MRACGQSDRVYTGKKRIAQFSVRVVNALFQRAASLPMGFAIPGTPPRPYAGGYFPEKSGYQMILNRIPRDGDVVAEIQLPQDMRPEGIDSLDAER